MPLFGKDPTKFGRNGDVNLKELAEVDFPIMCAWIFGRSPRSSARQARSMLHREARRCAVGGWAILAKIFGQNEAFMRAYPPVVREAENSPLISSQPTDS